MPSHNNKMHINSMDTTEPAWGSVISEPADRFSMFMGWSAPRLATIEDEYGGNMVIPIVPTQWLNAVACVPMEGAGFLREQQMFSLSVN